MWDVAIIGAGPAGLLLGAACAGRGLRVALWDPALDRPWPARYGCWADETRGNPLAEHIEWRYRQTVFWSERGRRALDRSYVRIDGTRLRATLLETLHRSGAGLFQAPVEGIAWEPEQAAVRAATGVVRARLVVDASGRGGPWLERVGRARPLAWQTAYGALGPVRAQPGVALDLDPHTATLMDWRPNPSAPHPTFLYVMPEADGRVFFEETVLAAAPAIEPEALRAPLYARLETLGVELMQEQEVELCRIAMDPPPPRPGQRCLAFGAASGVHPATGYSIAQSARGADPLACAISAGLASGAPQAVLTRSLWRAQLGPDVRLARDLQRFGGRLQQRLSGPDLARFLDTFFQQPRSAWSHYLGAPALGPTLAAMWGVFARGDLRLRGLLMGSVLGPLAPFRDRPASLT